MITSADMLLICAAFFTCSYLFFVLRACLGLTKELKGKGQVEGFDVIVPFRNETSGLQSLEIQLRAQFPEPANRIIFVNDGSQGYIPQSSGNVAVINNSGTGKKSALLTGVKEATSDNLLFLDADVVLPETFSREITRNWNGSGMCVLPVIQNGNSSLQKMITVETKLIMAISVGSVKMNDPVLANGAALLVNKTDWLENGHALNTKYASGDDVFMLYAFKKTGSVTTFLSKNNVVLTEAPRLWGDLFSQRIRWAGKGRAIRDFSAAYFGVTTVLMYLSFLINPFWFATDLQVVSFLILLLLKVLSEYSLLFLIDRRLEKRTPFSIFLLLEIVYPVFVCVVFLMGMFVKPQWKGRRI